MKVIVSTGQSNGRHDRNATLTQPLCDGVKFWHHEEAEWITTREAAAIDGLFTGSISTVLACHLARSIGHTIGVVSYAIGSQPILQWVGEESLMFAGIRDRTDAALAAAGNTQVVGMVWQQGESDVATSDATYKSRYATVLGQFQGESWFPETTPVILMGLVEGGSTAARNDSLQDIAGLHSHHIYVRGNGCDTSDSQHYSANGQEEMGTRMFAQAGRCGIISQIERKV